MKKLFVIGLLGFGVIAFAGCAGLKEGAKGVMGISTKILEEKRKEAVIFVAQQDYFTCYHKVADNLKKKGAYIYAQKPELIAFYVSETDTTPVGVFFRELGQLKTQIEISSPSSVSRDSMARQISAIFKESPSS